MIALNKIAMTQIQIRTNFFWKILVLWIALVSMCFAACANPSQTPRANADGGSFYIDAQTRLDASEVETDASVTATDAATLTDAAVDAPLTVLEFSSVPRGAIYTDTSVSYTVRYYRHSTGSRIAGAELVIAFVGDTGGASLLPTTGIITTNTSGEAMFTLSTSDVATFMISVTAPDGANALSRCAVTVP